MSDIVELQRKLQEARNETYPSKIRMRTAAMDDAAKLLRSGSFTPAEISYFLGIPQTTVEAEQARLDERERAKRKFQVTGELPNQLAHFTIYQR
jgi:hypothetical protein